MRLFAPLANRRIAWLWAGQVCSVTGDQLYGVALAWFAVSLVGGNAAYLVAVQALSVMASGMIGGMLADRLNRRTLMIALDAARAGAVLILPAMDLAGLPPALPVVYAVAVAMAALGAIFDPALQSAMSDLARSSTELRAINALLDGTKRLARIGSAGIIAICASFLPITQFFTLDAVTFLVSIATLLKAGQFHLAAAAAPTSASAAAARHQWARDLHLALRVAMANPWLRFNLWGTALGFASWQVGVIIGLNLLLQQTGANIDSFGVTLGIYAAASLVCNVVLGNLRRLNGMRAMLLGRFLSGLGYMVWLLAPAPVWLVVGALLSGTGSPLIDIPFFELIRRTTDPAHVGKIFALRIVVQNAGIVAGTLVAAPLLHLIGPAGLIAAFGFLNAGSAVLGAVRFRAETRIGIPETN